MVNSLKFSERMGFKSKNIIQINGMSLDLRIRLWNAFLQAFWKPGYNSWTFVDDLYKGKVLYLWTNYMKYLLDSFPKSTSSTRETIRKYFFRLKWYDVYDFIEFAHTDLLGQSKSFAKSCNQIFEDEKSGYRFISNKIAPITSNTEMEAVESATKTPFDAVNKHIATALNLLANKNNPDYRNSIKESISAVESICKIITKNDKATLGNALSEIEKKGDVKLHKALIKAFDTLYGYTNDEKGIRHSLLDLDNTGLEEAQFMLISCSAFVNYLLTKMD